MPDAPIPEIPRTLILPLAEPPREVPARPPILTSPVSRGAGGEPLDLVENVRVTATFELARAARSADAPTRHAEDFGARLLALEADDGTTVFLRADRLTEQLDRLCPECATADGALDLALFRDREGTTWGGPAGWLWRRLSVLDLTPDALIEEARRRAAEWMGAEAADRILREQGERALFAVSWQGAKALMAAIEGRLGGEPGLYQWQGTALAAGDLCRADDPRFRGWERDPGVVFIHGTASSTLGSFGDLADGDDWQALRRAFGERIFCLEHRTLSESPIDNALSLVEILPAGARLSLVTHSRGGLVGDLVALGGFTAETRRLVDEYRRRPRPDEEEAEAADASGRLRALREAAAADERAKLLRLLELLERKALRVERYVRVACPAGGTALLSDNLEVFLSGLLDLVRRAGAWGLGAVAGALATPVTGAAAAGAADRVLRLLTRVVLELADKRVQPQLVPGLEAMLPEAPMGAFLARAPRARGAAMGVIAGDIEGGGVLRRVGVLFTDWMFFDRADNDLVVDTASMSLGLAVSNAAHLLFDQGENVNHFSYFRNPRTRAGVRGWLLAEDPSALPDWQALPVAGAESPAAVRAAETAARGGEPQPVPDSRPVVILLPGIMGSHLEVARRKPAIPGSGDRVWLDFLELPRGALARIAAGRADIEPEDLLDLAYGKLARHLGSTHRVIRFAYDWRLGVPAAAERLAALVRETLALHPHQPVRLLAHSMGGLVARALIAAHTDAWRALTARPGGRLVMLGTPNHGSHLMVETLLGKSGTIRTLARVDLTQDLNQVLAIVAGFPGALQLLPRPGFTDTGGPAARDWLDAATWPALAEGNHDFWFGRRLGGRPTAADLEAARDLWALLGTPEAERERIGPVERIAYVYGQADNTPCGVRVGARGIEMLGTPRGDGSVTWDSGRLDWLPETRCWHMPVDHGALTGTESHFEDIRELLDTGAASRLGRLPTLAAGARGLVAASPLRVYQPGPPPAFPSEAELVARLVGGHARVRPARAPRRCLAVGVRAMDLRFLQVPVVCGHYLGDPLAGPEARIDQYLVEGALTRRLALGVYAGPVGSTSVVLMPRTREDRRRGSGRGAIVVGLGEMGNLSTDEITETVRAGVLRLLLHADDRAVDALCVADGAPDPDGNAADYALYLASLLIGSNSTTHIPVDESVRAVTLGVIEANRQFEEGLEARAGGTRRRAVDRQGVRVARLEFVEVFRDAAISAAHAVRRLPEVLSRDARRVGSCIEPDPELNAGPGVRERLALTPSFGYWPRLIVTDADAPDTPCPSECWQTRTASPIPAEVVDALLARHGCTRREEAAPAPVRRALRLKFVYLGQRARAEALAPHHCQPGLVERLVADLVRHTGYSPGAGIGNTLFHLLVPLAFKSAARESGNLMLVVDPATAGLPWEMLEADGEPLVLRTRLIRQLVSPRFRAQVRVCRDPSALLIVNPDTAGYHAEFGAPGWTPRTRPDGTPAPDRLPSLTGAVAEGQAVAAILGGSGVRIVEAADGSPADLVFQRLFERPYRVLVIAAHGVHRVRGGDGAPRTGVVLSDGLLLTANEIGLMESVPELVFLNCCHLGKMDGADAAAAGSHRLAYSLSRELIEMGVRCVVAAGWEVDDAAGRTFAEVFFTRMTAARASFAQAVYEARLETRARHPNANTFGAYQAYGDPDYRLGDEPLAEPGAEQTLLAPEELINWLERRGLEASREGGGEGRTLEQRLRDLERRIDRRLGSVPPAWLDRADVQQALGVLYGELGAPGHGKARAALLRAVSEEARGGVVPIAAIERLANLEVCQAERLGRSGSPADRETALALVEDAVVRLEQLTRITGPAPRTGQAPPGAPPAVNTERQGLLGSAFKRRAALLAAGGAGWTEVAAVLETARAHYAVGAGQPGAPGFDPYTLINRMQLDAVLDHGDPDRDRLIAACQDAARRRFGDDFAFFDGVMSIDAALVPCLHPRGDGADADPRACALDGLLRDYRDAMTRLSPSERERESVVAHLCLLAVFIRLRSGPGDAELAATLADLVAELDPTRPPCYPDAAPPEAAKPRNARPAGPGKGRGGSGGKGRGGDEPPVP